MKKIFYILIFIFLAMGLLISFGILQTEFGGSDLTIQDVSFVKDAGKVQITAKALTPSNDLKFFFDQFDVSSKLSDEGYVAEKDISGRISIINQTKVFDLLNKSEEIFYDFEIKSIGRFVACSKENCRSQAPNGYSFTEKAFRNASYDCICLYKKKLGFNYEFSDYSQDFSSVEININGAIAKSKTTLSEELRLNDGRTSIYWEGSLNSENLNQKPNFNVLYGENSKLIDKNSFSSYGLKVEEFGKCMGNSGFNYISLLSPVFLIITINQESASSCLARFDENIEKVLTSKTSEYENFTNSKISFGNNKMTAEIHVKENMPSFMIKTDPKVFSLREMTFDEKETYQDSVKANVVVENSNSQEISISKEANVKTDKNLFMIFIVAAVIFLIFIISYSLYKRSKK